MWSTRFLVSVRLAERADSSESLLTPLSAMESSHPPLHRLAPHSAARPTVAGNMNFFPANLQPRQRIAVVLALVNVGGKRR